MAKKEEIKEVLVEKVGRKYVTCCRERYQESDNDDGLVGVGEYWSVTRLFPTKETAENKLEKDRICSWIVNQLSYKRGVQKYSLEDLRQVKQILAKGE